MLKTQYNFFLYSVKDFFRCFKRACSWFVFSFRCYDNNYNHWIDTNVKKLIDMHDDLIREIKISGFQNVDKETYLSLADLIQNMIEFRHINIRDYEPYQNHLKKWGDITIVKEDGVLALRQANVLTQEDANACGKELDKITTDFKEIIDLKQSQIALLIAKYPTWVW